MCVFMVQEREIKQMIKKQMVVCLLHVRNTRLEEEMMYLELATLSFQTEKQNQYSMKTH